MRILAAVLLPFAFCAVVMSAERLDERPATDKEWGYHPGAGAVSSVNPPSFSWRPNHGVVAWEVECGRGGDFKSIEYRADRIVSAKSRRVTRI
jgi:hypothetical protein